MINGSILNALNILSPISLEKLGGVRLMNRVEKKYIFSISRLADMIYLMENKYKVLEINNLRALPYKTTYLDTPEHLFYNQHIRGQLERQKIRYRMYETTGDTYLEVKKKYSNGRTSKWRLKDKSAVDMLDNVSVKFINEHMSADLNLMNPVLINSFTRTTLISMESNERITLDTNITFIDPDNKKILFIPFLTIAELKWDGYSRYKYFDNIMRRLSIRPTGFSKYCIGSAVLNESLKRNMIKPKLLMLNKIEDEYINAYSN
jgi:hypothetical protein